MELIVIVIILIGVIGFMEYKELSKNNIRHDEAKYIIIALVCALILLLIFLGVDFRSMIF